MTFYCAGCDTYLAQRICAWCQQPTVATGPLVITGHPTTILTQAHYPGRLEQVERIIR